MALTGKEPYRFDVRFERALVAMLCGRPRVFNVIGAYLDPDLLGSPSAKLAVQAAQAIANDVGHGPDRDTIVIQRLRRWLEEGKVSQAQIGEVVDLLEAADDDGMPEEDTVLSEVVPILKRRKQHASLMRAIDVHGKRGDLGKIAAEIQAADRIGVVDESLGVLVDAGTFEEITRNSRLARLATGIALVDEALGGGLPIAAQGLVIADTGAGKSMFLVHVSCKAIWEGVHVAYATLELTPGDIYARVVANVTGATIDSLHNGGIDEARATFCQIQRDRGLGQCFIKDFTPGATEVKDILAWVKRVETHLHEPIGLLVVDYADRLTAGDEKTYDAMKVVADGLRNFAVEHGIRGWTASQSKGRDKDELNKMVDQSHVADSKHKVRIADVIVTLTPKADGNAETPTEILYFIAKNRFGAGRKKVGPLAHDWASGRMVVINPEAPKVREDLPF